MELAAGSCSAPFLREVSRRHVGIDGLAGSGRRQVDGSHRWLGGSPEPVMVGDRIDVCSETAWRRATAHLSTDRHSHPCLLSAARVQRSLVLFQVPASRAGQSRWSHMNLQCRLCQPSWSLLPVLSIAS